jgi:hypothetical protein
MPEVEGMDVATVEAHAGLHRRRLGSKTLETDLQHRFRGVETGDLNPGPLRGY